ncbi:serine carboxypeptidase-like 50 [Cornus florida]|uniref:serine carboxypeptidase-like 50 n=1 Tax=Cornus florida TaxID=4283 RepID=UPI0028A06711|nr:serine carboxypeptidase-like 50 [Cornus florida]
MESTPPIYCLKLLLFLSVLLHHHFPTISSATSTPLLPQDALPTKSGYLPVNSTTGSAIFYTFYEAQTPNSPLSKTPLLIWLQGGPGCSSMLGNFYELGPWRLSSHKQNVEHLALEPNSGSWNRLFGLLFLDNPIGTGFSIASTPEEIPRDQHGVAKHLFTAITSFVALDPSFKLRPIYITGESYAGKYVPAIGYYILKKNAQLPALKQVNLAGVAIGNGLTDPVTQVATHAVNAYFSGLINQKQKTQLEELQNEAVKLTKIGNWSVATNARNRVLNMLQNMTGLATLYDFRRLVPYETSLVSKFLANVEVKKALGVNTSMVYEECSDVVGAALHEDVMKSVKYMVEFLVRNTKVLLYQGHCDLRDGVVSTEAWVKKMKWEGIGKFKEAERKVWKVNGLLAGYVQKWGSLSHVVVLGAGHLVPTDQAVNSQAMIEDWVLERALFAGEQIGNPSANFRGAL